jgi:hypothetical protein
MKEKAQTQQVIDYLIENNVDKFTIKEMWDQFPNIKPNTMSTLVSRDLKKKGLVIPIDKSVRPVIYQFYPEGKPLLYCNEAQFKTISALELESKPILKPIAHKPIPEPEPDSYDSYVKIGKAIEQLLEDKNNTIHELEIRCAGLKKNLIDSQATVQDRDRHIVEQGKKICELNEKIRNKSGGSIKLDELQSIING